MKKLLSLVVFVVFILFYGCATIEYEGFKYSRLGNQELIDVTIVMKKSADGSMFLDSHVGRQFSEREIENIVLQILNSLDYIKQ